MAGFVCWHAHVIFAVSAPLYRQWHYFYEAVLFERRRKKVNFFLNAGLIVFIGRHTFWRSICRSMLHFTSGLLAMLQLLVLWILLYFIFFPSDDFERETCLPPNATYISWASCSFRIQLDHISFSTNVSISHTVLITCVISLINEMILLYIQ